MRIMGHITVLLQGFLLGMCMLTVGTLQAQQGDFCNNCPCVIPGMSGTTLSTVAFPDNQTITYPNLQLNPTTAPAGPKYFRFNPQPGRTYTISVCGAPLNTIMYVTTSTVGILACDIDGCGAPNGPSVASVLIGAPSPHHRIYLFNGSCGTAFPPNTTIDITITSATSTPPPNDEVCFPTPLPMTGQDCNFTISTNLGATMSSSEATGLGTLPTCTGALFQGADVWFTTTVPASGLIGIQTQEGGVCAGAFQIYTSSTSDCSGTFTMQGNCHTVGLTGPTSEPAAVFDAFAAGLAVGSTIYIRYWERGGNENGSFQICAYEAIRPPNDEPCGAIPLPLGITCSPMSFTNENASPLGTMTAPPVAAGCGGPATNDIWFSFVVPTPVPPAGITVNTINGSLNNMAMAWYRVSSGTVCGSTPPYGALQQIGCNQNQSASDPMPRISSTSLAPLTAGETIYVRLWSETPWMGTAQICAYENQAPVNDDPCGALPLDLNYGCVLSTYSNDVATLTPNPNTVGLCGGGYNADVWFTVTVPPNGELEFDTQAGGLTDAAMAVYRVASGACATGNLNLQLITGTNCATINSQQGTASNNMPRLNITGQPAGTTLYVRVWRQNGNDGTFGLCARRTDPPPGDCFYTLNMFDSAADGWGGSYVTVCVGGNCTNYTVNGSSASVNIGANIGQVISVSYTAAGGFQSQNSYNLTQFNNPVYASSAPPQQGGVFIQTVDCEPPPAPQSDCVGAVTLCDQVPQVNQQPQAGTQELNASNRGCLLGNEHTGLWYTFTVETAGPIAFTITPNPISSDWDFAVWGPYPPGTSHYNVCPPTQQPLRCNWSGTSGATGLQVNGALPTSVGAVGPPFSQHIMGNVGDVYLLYVDKWTTSAFNFGLTWQGTGGVGCIELPMEFLGLQAHARERDVVVEWSTASERNSAWFDVERSSDGITFEAIGRVTAAGISTSLREYQFIDQRPLDGLSYYRVQQVDATGMMVSSNAVAVLRTPAKTLEVHPNPAKDQIWLNMVLDTEEMVSWDMVDMSGRRVSEGNFLGAAGRNAQPISIAHLDQGSYMLRIMTSADGDIGFTRFVKQ